MKPPTSEKVVFGKGNAAAERIRRGKQVGTRVLDSLAPASHRYSEHSVGIRGMAAAKKAEEGVVSAGKVLREELSEVLATGATLQAPTEHGGKVTATGASHDEGTDRKTAWHLNIESAKGRTTEFSVDVIDRGDSPDSANVARVDVINPNSGKSHAAHNYVGEGEAETYRSVETAFQQLHRAHDDGTLIVQPMPAEATDRQLPTPA